MGDTIERGAYRVLFVDDEPLLLETFRNAFEGDFEILTAGSGAEALAVLEATPGIAVLVTDQKMPGMRGIDVIRRAVEVRPDVVPIILTGFSDHESAVEAVNLRRVHCYLQKPWDENVLRAAVRDAIEAYHLRRENERLTAELRRACEQLAAENVHLRAATTESHEIVGRSGAIEAVRVAIGRAARDPHVTVLVHGETGTGKELVARAIHAGSPRAEHMFVARNCAAFPEALLESELFGHQKGAFTGAATDRKGLFEVADAGTLFLDEVSELPLGLQAKLLRVLQEGEVVRLGDHRSRRVDVRVVAATNRDLAAWVREGRFRQDLYHRLCVYPIRVPPLRERRDDIPMLVEHILARLCARRGRPTATVAADTLDLLVARDYPGNVRELGNLLEQAVVNSVPGEEILEAHFAEALAPAGARRGTADSLDEAVLQFERVRIERALRDSNGNKSQAARDLGLTYRGFLKKIARLGLRGDEPRPLGS